MVTPFLLVYLVLSWARAQDPFSDQPKLFSENGNLKLQAGRDRNITLLTSGSGQVYLNSENLVQLSGLARTASDQVNSFKWTVLPPIQQKLYRLVRAVEGRDGLIRKMQQLESGNASISAPRGGSSSTLSDLNIKVKRIDRQLKKVTANLRKNECLGNPCRNGGTCIDLYNRFLCLCPAGWEGPACDTDVNECAKFKSTEDGCHNGGTCVNIPGGFQCICPPHYYGVHCNAKNFTCNGVSDAELCGHGSCREQGGSYVCVCDEGWSNGPGGVCNKDINECNTKTPVCSVSPPVQCINTPGSFQCAPCPTGYTGNGLYCVDVDECLVNNGGCSMTPYVECINTQGYRKCGQCPHGWVGDGTTCRQGTTGCSVQNGGCHPLATCRETSDTVRSVISCSCPPGMGGSGVGLMGCAYGMSGNPCGGVTCEHGGICAPIGDRGYRCQCEPGFTGKNCEVSMNLSCLNNPCENGGTCTTTSQLEVRCLCPDGYSGPYCADQMMACGGTIVRSNGTLHNSLNGYNTRSVHSCIWTLDSGVVDRVLTISFSKFTVYSKRGDCIDNYLELRDAEFPTDASSHLGRFCSPHALPPSNVTSYSSKVIVTYMSSVKNNEIFDEWQLQWTSSKSDCVFSLHNITSPGSISTPGYPRYYTKMHTYCVFSLHNITSPGSISTPGYPRYYTKMHTCMWSLSATPGYRLELTISDVELGSNNADDCLKINDGEMVYSPVLLKVCQSGRNLSPVTTSGSEALVWPSDLPDVKGNTRLQITYRPVPGVPGCGGTFTFPEGDISSSQLQDSNQDLLCEWTIHLTAEERIKLYFNKVQIGSRSCDSYLEVYNGHSTSLMSKFCDGASSLAPLTSSGNTVRLVYKTKYVWGATKPSFSIHYETVCGGVFTSPRGDLKSPLYPRGYPTSRLCQYTISQPPGKIITLDFQAMGLRAPDKKKACPYESVKVYDGDSKNHSLIGEYCGTNIPTTIVSKYNVLYLEFKTDGVSGEESDRFGFHANYSTLDLGCGGIYTESSGLISFTSRSPPSSCEWILSVPPGNALQLTWISFSVGASDDPETRWFGYSIMASRYPLKPYHENLLNLEVYDNVTRPGRIMDRLHGARTPGPMTSVGNVVTLVLKKPKTSFRSGTPSSASFVLSYMAVNLSTTCGGNFYSPEGTLTSPQYPDPYPPNMLCVWTLTVPRGQQIRLNFTTFQLERYFCNPTCGDTDYLEVRDGGYESSPQLGIYCCKNHPGEITSSGHQLYIKFFSDDDRFKYPGFKITWDSASTGCGGILTGSSGSIISPGYPYPYAYRTTCYWKIYVSQGSSITLWSLDVQLDCNKLLASDLEVFEGGTSGGPLLGTYCPRRGGPWLMSQVSQPTKWQSVIQSQTNVVLIKYTVNNMEDKGFHLQYKTLCNRTLSGYRGVIESVNYPRAVTPGLECYWNITVPTGNQIRFAFTDLALQPMPRFGTWLTGCSSYVEILQNNQVDAWYNSGSTEMHPLLNKTCRIEKPLGALTTTSNMAVVHFHSAYFASRGKGFRLEWALKGCGGVFDKRPTGTITSPHYGEHMNGKYYQHSLQCDWQIKADLDHSIQITIEDLDLETVGDCSRDYLIIYNGLSDQGVNLTDHLCLGMTITIYNGLSDQGVNLTDHLCLGMTKPITVTASNAAFIRFMSDSSVAGRGFKLTYKQVPSSCGGLYSGTSGVIHSKNYPKLFDQYDDCLYQITVADGHLVQLTMEDLDLGYYQLWGKNKGNVVYVYDGDSVNGTLLKNYTGNSISPNSSTTISSSNKMLVHFKANAMPHSGFKASYKLACGARIDTDGSGNLVLNVADIIATKGANCTWTIMAKNPESRVSLAVTSTFPNLDMYQIEEPSNKFFVYDGETTRSPNLVQSSVIKIPHSIVSKGPAMHIVLSLDSMDTDYLSQFKWFATYSVRNIACGGELTGCRGTFSSPNYPLQYPLNTECVWTVKSSPGNKMAVQFPVFQLEDSDKCNEDYVEIREADAQGKLLGVYCSSQVPLNVSVDAAFWIKFKSNGVGTATGFTADYYYVEDIEIQGQTGGLITSPQYPTPLSEYKKFSYTIRVSDGAKIRITILESYLSGHSDECEFGGTLKVFEGTEALDSKLLHPNLCTAPLNTQFISLTSEVLVVFEGTEALDSKLLHPNLCTAPLNTQFISLTSEVLVVFESSGLRLGSYFKLKWEAVPAGTTVAGNTTEVNKTSGGLSDFPYLINPRVFSYDLTLVNSSINISHHSLNSSKDKNPEVPYLINPRVFGYDLTLTNSSVNISHHSLNNSKDTYVFKFTALQGYRLTLVMMNYSNVVSMDPDTAQRYRVKLQVYSGSSDPFRQGDVVKRLEISDNPGSIVDVRNKRTVTSYNNVLYVVIEQETFGSEDTGPTAMKFNATVTLTCGGIITGQLSGRIEMNPSIENVTFFPLNNRFLVPMIPMTCDWVVAVRPRRTLTVKMITADFTPKTKSGDAVECGDNFLQIKNGGSISSPKLGKEDKFCATILAKNSKKQTAMSTSSNLLYVRYETKYNQPKSFALSFEETSVSCGGEVILYEGGNTWASLTSPNYPDPPPTHVECTWTILAPPHKKLQIEFDENFDLKSSAKCETEYVEVNDGSTEVSPSLGKYCIQTPPIMKSTGNSMLVHYFTDADDPKDGFKANVSFQSCGGFTKNILGPYILSADLSQLTEPLCEWTLVTAPTNYFTLNVTTFNANSLGRYATNCDRFDQLHIYTVDHFDRNRLFSLTCKCI
ncbi:hypothetical protein M8J77_014895 [Diaphorina citri]|nr:hypothetical protein M8J77_014895 [Diaphorina citri]